MGSSMYSSSLKATRDVSSNLASKSIREVFTQRHTHKDMNPHGVTIREARDSETHPNAIPIIFGLDVTGSLGDIPHSLIKGVLPKIMDGIMAEGIPDPQIMFACIGDHICDNSPLQVGQFESGDVELDMWLERSHIEGGGGGNGGESYSLVHFFAANNTVTDHWEKRGKKGILITIGDEPSHNNYPASMIKALTGNGDVAGFTDTEALAKAREKWEVFHILPGMTTSGGKGYWKELLGDNAVWVESKDQIADAIKNIVTSVVKNQGTAAKQSSSTVEPTVEVKTEKPTEEFL